MYILPHLTHSAPLRSFGSALFEFFLLMLSYAVHSHLFQLCTSYSCRVGIWCSVGTRTLRRSITSNPIQAPPSSSGLLVIPRLVAPFSLIIPFSHSPPMLALSVVPSLHLFVRATGRAGFQFVYFRPLRSRFFIGFHFRTPPTFHPPDAFCYHHRRGQPSTRAVAPSIRMPTPSHYIGTQIPLLPLFFGKFTVR